MARMTKNRSHGTKRTGLKNPVPFVPPGWPDFVPFVPFVRLRGDPHEQDREAEVLARRDQVHPAADLFPMMSPDELKALGEDIKKTRAEGADRRRPSAG